MAYSLLPPLRKLNIVIRVENNAIAVQVEFAMCYYVLFHRASRFVCIPLGGDISHWPAAHGLAVVIKPRSFNDGDSPALQWVASDPLKPHRLASDSEGASKGPIEMGYVSKGLTRQPIVVHTTHSNRLTEGRLIP